MLQMAGRMGVLGTETAFEVLARANALAAQGRSIINLGIVVSIPNFAAVATNFHLDWTYAGGTLDGDVPTIQFNDVQVDIGSFFSSFVSPIISKIQTLTKPLQPVVDVLTKRLPVLSDLSDLVGQGDVTLEKLLDTAMSSQTSKRSWVR